MVSSNTLCNLAQLLRNCDHLIRATQIHAALFKSGFLFSTPTSNHLINCYIRGQEIALAHRMFDEMREPNVVSWTSLMAGYIDMGRPEFALRMYTRMPESSVSPNEFTLSTVINACSVLADYETGKKIHAHVELFGFQSKLVVCSSLVDMYGKCNNVDWSRRVFDAMGYRNVVSWTSIIAAYAQNGKGNEALETFREFSCSICGRPNHFMLCSVINACAGLGKLTAGKVGHGAVIRNGYDSNVRVANTLVDMYAKCGSFEYSDTVFRKIRNPSAVSYTSMIVGAGEYGLGELSLELFDEMVDQKIKPNDVTLLGVLHACSHAGLVDEGLRLLNSMYEKHGIMPGTKHYCCAVDMLSRVGRLDEAYRLANLIRPDPNHGALLWCTLLSASRLQGRIDIASEVSKRLVETNQQGVVGAYVMLSNTFASAGDWESACSLRIQMKHTGIRKDPAFSWIEIRDSTYVFYAGDLSFGSGNEVMTLLRELERRMREKSYVLC